MVNEITFRPPLWRRVAVPLVVSLLLGGLVFQGLFRRSDLELLPVRLVLIGVCLSAIVVAVWMHRGGHFRPEGVSLSEGLLRLHHGGKVDEVRWTEIVSLWVNQAGKVLVVNRHDGSSIHAHLGTFGEGDLREIERLARERLARVPPGASRG